jgi:hypothetical protein
MGLSRLENFLRSVRGNIIYVDPNSLDSTDSIENTGSALTRPFKTIQRALIEAARFSYLPGFNNDKFTNTTIVLYPGDHVIDNRPGWIPISSSQFQLRDGSISTDFNEFDLQTNFDVTTKNNALYKFNSVKGGVIVPRGTSIVGMDLRKTKIRPTYVPDPTLNPDSGDDIDRASIFQLTGGCYIWQLSIFDADPNGKAFKDYSNDQYTPNYSHHKLTTFEYADGANTISINDNYLTYSTPRTDLDIYYEKIGLAYGPSSGRNIAPDYPSADVDIQTKIDEFRIVGSRGAEVGITSIKAGDGTTPGITNVITVTTDSELEGLAVDTPIRINGVGETGYDGQFIVGAVNNTREIQYLTPITPTVAFPGAGGTLNITVDTVTSASPYVFNCSLRSVYGMCGLHADGSRVTGFKSMVVAQFTGISLQKDNNAFVKYNEQTGTYQGSADGVENIYSDSLARYKPEYESFHIKASNNAFIQCVSIFAIGYANHFLGESGGDMSITNSNSNFGSTSLVSKGFSGTKFNKDDVGYISHIIPPKHIDSKEITLEFEPIDIQKTTSVVGNTNKLYISNRNSISSPPIDIIDGYRVGGKKNDTINFTYQSGGFTATYSAFISMGPNLGSYEKTYSVDKNGLGNQISSNIITLTADHDLSSGETVRIISNTGQLPGNILADKIYYAIVGGSLAANQIKLASSFNDAINGSSEVSIFSNETSDLTVVSRVSDKNAGDLGHPIQWDSTEGQWFIYVTSIGSIGSLPLTEVSPRTFLKRISDSRSVEDTLYKFRYVIPKDSTTKSRPPVDGFAIQISSDNPETASEIDKQYSPSLATKELDNSNQLRNTRFIASASFSSNTVTIKTERPHYLSAGSVIEIRQVLSSLNSSGIFNSGFNGSFTVSQVLSRKEFTYTLTTNPGDFINNTSVRDLDLPYFVNKTLPSTYYIYRSNAIQEYVENAQDGIYYLTVLNASSSPLPEPFTHLNFSQPIKNLYSQIDKDNPNEDPDSASSFALPTPLGQVVVDDPQNSITKKTLESLRLDYNSGFEVNNFVSFGSTATITTKIEHGLNPITKLTIVPGSIGQNYGSGSGLIETLYNARLVGFAGSITGEGATAVITVNSAGQLSNIEIMDGGSAYGIGNTLSVVGVATTTGFVPAVVRVSNIYNHEGDSLDVDGFSDVLYDQYNQSYIIKEISGTNTIEASVLDPTTPIVLNSSQIPNVSGELTGRIVKYSSLEYNSTSKKIVINDSSYFPYVKIGQKIKTFVTPYYRLFTIKDIKDLGSTIELTIDPADNNLDDAFSTGGTILPLGNTSEDGENTENNEDRIIAQYAGISTVTTSIVSLTDSTVSLSNVDNLGLKIGDYLEINNEIVRINRTVNTNPIQIFRGSLGTNNEIHPSGSIVRKVYPLPIELRRYTILRASGHTFEYVGFGPGNYSNSLPERQDREKTPQEDLLSQSLETDGGVNVYTGMNNDGDYYIGNKRVNPATGQEDVFDAPFQTLRGKESEVLNDEPINFVSTQEINVSKSIKVEGGDGNLVSEFNGPVIFNNKITSNSPRGIEGNSLFLQGDEIISRKYTIGISTPTNPGNAGDVVFESEPSQGGTVGWVYTSEGIWENFGKVSINGTISEGAVGIEVDGSSIGLSHDLEFVGGTGVSISGAYDSVSRKSTLTFSVVSSNFTNLFVSGISTFQGNAFFNSPVSLSDNLSSTGTITGDVVKGTSVEVANTLSGTTANSAISISKFTAANSNFSGNVTLGETAKTTNTSLSVLSGNNKQCGIQAYGNSRCLGYLYVGEDLDNGGGIYYNGDTTTNPFASSEVEDTVSFYRKFAGNNITVFYCDNSTAIGNNITFLGSVSAQDINSSSDERLKKNVEKIEDSSEILSQLDGVKFTWNETEKDSYGVIAQQVEKVLPELVSENGEYKTVNYNGLVAVLIESLKSQQERITALEAKIDSLTQE